MAGRILPDKLQAFAESGSGHLKMMSANDIVDDYYSRVYAFSSTHPLSYGATTGLSLPLCMLQNSAWSTRWCWHIGAFGISVIAPRYLLPQEVLEDLSLLKSLSPPCWR